MLVCNKYISKDQLVTINNRNYPRYSNKGQLGFTVIDSFVAVITKAMRNNENLDADNDAVANFTASYSIHIACPSLQCTDPLRLRLPLFTVRRDVFFLTWQAISPHFWLRICISPSRQENVYPTFSSCCIAYNQLCIYSSQISLEITKWMGESIRLLLRSVP